MINAVYNRKYFSLKVEGHAYAGEHGKDIVCSAASILAYTLASAISGLEDKGIVRDVIVEMHEGLADVRCTPIRKHENTARLIFDTLTAGYTLLTRKYPQNIQFEIRG